MSNLRRAIEDQAMQFASAVVQALRGASLEDLMTINGGGGRVVSRVVAPKSIGVAPKRRRLGRRSANDIAKTLDQIVKVLGKHPQGLRAEQIKAALQLDTREMPRPVAEGLKSGVLIKKGQKRATTYFAGAGDTKKRTKK